MSILSVDGLTTCYGRIEAVKGISLHVEEGEIVALVGANGAGKTTTLLTISGVLRPTAGTIRLAGEVISGLGAHQIVSRGLSQVVEGRAVFGGLTVLENLLVGAYARRSRRAIQSDIDAMFDRFPRIRERAWQPAGTLSGGEQQMLAIARALMSRPRVLLLDEPSMGLAPIILDEIFQLIAEINRAGTTVLLVEQNALKALDLSNRAYVMASGRIVADGNARALLTDGQLAKAYLGVAV